jgi:transposase-like protein
VLTLKCIYSYLFVFIRKINFELVKKAIQLILDNPSISNLEIAKQLGINEGTVRHWKKQLFWEVERQKMIDDRAEITQELIAENRSKYLKDLRESQNILNKFVDGVKSNAALSLSLANAAYSQVLTLDDTLDGCYQATKAGIHIQSRNAREGMTALIGIYDQLYQISLLIEYFEKLDDDGD